MIWEHVLFFILSGIFLVLSGIFLVKSLDKIAKFLRISEFTAAFIIMAVATSIPELFVGISSAIQGNPELSLGNVIGANIIDLTIITGIFILLAKGIKLKSGKVGAGVYFMFASISLLILLYFIGNSISRFDGVILVSLFLVNSYRMFRKKEKYFAESKQKRFSRKEIVASSLIFSLSLLVLFISSNYIVKYAGLIALDFSLPQIIVGLFLISIATTLPELVFGIDAVLLSHSEMAIGDQIGTVFTNICLIIGIVAIIHPITSSMLPFAVSSAFMLLSAFLFVIFIKTGRKLEVIEGVSLILLYLFFVTIQFFIR